MTTMTTCACECFGVAEVCHRLLQSDCLSGNARHDIVAESCTATQQGGVKVGSAELAR